MVDDLDNREREIREQISALQAELEQLQAAKTKLDEPPTIKSMALTIIADAELGIGTSELLAVIKDKWSLELDEAGLSQELADLGKAGQVLLIGDRWWNPPRYEEMVDAFGIRA